MVHAAFTKDFLWLVHQSCRREGWGEATVNTTSAPWPHKPSVRKTHNIQEQMAMTLSSDGPRTCSGRDLQNWPLLPESYSREAGGPVCPGMGVGGIWLSESTGTESKPKPNQTEPKPEPVSRKGRRKTQRKFSIVRPTSISSALKVLGTKGSHSSSSVRRASEHPPAWTDLGSSLPAHS